MTQPPLSAAIAQLEQEVGSRLFHRGSRGVTLTITGKYLAREAVSILEAVDEAAYRVRSLEQGREGVVTVAAMPAAAWELVPAVLSDFAVKSPDADIRLRELAQLDLLESVATGKTDLGFVVTASAERLQERYTKVLHIERLISVEMIAALSAEYRDAPDPISLRALADASFALPVRGVEVLTLREVTLQAFDRARLPHPRVFETLTLQEAMPLVIAGIAVSVVPESMRRVVSDGIVLKRIHEGPRPFEIAVAYPHERELSPAAQRLLGSAREVSHAMDEAWQQSRE